MSVTVDLRFDARPSARVEQFFRDTTITAFGHFRDAETLQYVNVTGVSARAWIPGGALLDPAPTVAEVRAGVWSLTIAASAAVWSGTWRIEISCTGPSAELATRDFVLSAPEPDEALPPAPVAVTSVAGRVGAVTLTAADVSYTDRGGDTALPLTAVLRGLKGRALDEFGTVDRAGATDMAGLINDAIEACLGHGDPVWSDRGIHRLGGPILLRSSATSSTHFYAHDQAEFVGYFDQAGGNAMVMAAPGFNETDNPLRRIRLWGGRYRRNGVISGDNEEIWTGNTGNVIGFWAEDADLRDLWVTRYSGGRAVMPRGGKWRLDGVRVWDPSRADGMATPVNGGTGGIRATVIREMICENSWAHCGDDCFQVVPGTTDLLSMNVVYSKFYGISTTARVAVVGLGGSTPISGSIRHITFAHGRGEGVQPVQGDNDDSSGDVSVLFFDVKVSIRPAPPHKTNNDATNAVFVLSSQSAQAGAQARFTVRDCEALNVIAGALQVAGLSTSKVVVDGFRAPAPTLASATRAVVAVDDCDDFTMRNFEIVGPGALNSLSTITLGTASTATRVRKAVFEDGKITGVAAATAGIFVTNSGADDLTVSRVTIEPHPDASADAIRCGNDQVSLTVRDSDFSLMDSAPISGTLPPNTVIENTKMSGTTLLYQQVAAATTVAWNGRSKYIRLTAAADTTIEIISIPSGYVFRDVPEITLFCASNFAYTFDHSVSGGSGRMQLAGAADVVANIRDHLTVVYDMPTETWRQKAFVAS